MLITVICKKCLHEISLTVNKIEILLKTDCPECGEEPYDNWILHSTGF